LQGKIVEVRDEGTIIQIVCERTQGAGVFTVNFDHRPFTHFLESLGGKVIGKEIDYDEDTKQVSLINE